MGICISYSFIILTLVTYGHYLTFPHYLDLLCSPLDVMHTFYDVRVDYYGKRKNHLLGTLTEAWEKLDNKVRNAIVSNMVATRALL